MSEISEERLAARLVALSPPGARSSRGLACPRCSGTGHRQRVTFKMIAGRVTCWSSFLPDAREGIKMRKWAKQVFLDRVRLCGGLIYVLPSPAWALFSSTWGCCSQKQDGAELCIPGLPDFAEAQLSPRAGIGGPWHPRTHVHKLLGGGCPWRSFLYPPYSKEQMRAWSCLNCRGHFPGHSGEAGLICPYVKGLFGFTFTLSSCSPATRLMIALSAVLCLSALETRSPSAWAVNRPLRRPELHLGPEP